MSCAKRVPARRSAVEEPRGIGREVGEDAVEARAELAREHVAGGFALFSALSGQAAIGGIILAALVMCIFFSAIPMVISWVIIKKLESDAAVRECTPTSIFHEDRFTHTFE